MDEDDDRILRKYGGPVDIFNVPIKVQPRQAGKGWTKALQNVLIGSAKDPATQEYTLRDGSRIDDVSLRSMDVSVLESIHRKMQGTHPVRVTKRQPMQMPTDINDVTVGTIVTWKSKGIFTYAAIKAAKRWFITGNGTFYGSNEFTHARFCNDVLSAAEVSDIQIVTDLLPLELPI